MKAATFPAGGGDTVHLYSVKLTRKLGGIARQALWFPKMGTSVERQQWFEATNWDAVPAFSGSLLVGMAQYFIRRCRFGRTRQMGELQVVSERGIVIVGRACKECWFVCLTVNRIWQA